MKKLILLFSLVSCSFGVAQEKSNDLNSRKHEVKLGAIKMLSATIFEGTYEYIQSKDFTYGASLLFNLDKPNDYTENFSITPFARFYFQETKEYGAKGFFVEGFGKYTEGKRIIYSSNAEYNTTAIGLGLGKKWVNKTGFVFEILVGGARTLGNSDVAPDALLRGDLNIGYRF
jgi:hypothetical protein